MAAKIAVRCAVLFGLLALVGAAVPLLTAVPADGRLLGAIALAAMYLAVWVAVATALATRPLPSDANALAMLAVWLAWVVVGPALVTTLAASRFPAPEALALTVAQREGYHGSWDRPVPETMAAFFARYPEWREHQVPSDRYSNAWYYAMQQRGDDAAAPVAEAYLTTLRARHAWTGEWMWLFPPAALQSALDRLARTDLPAHLAYLDSVASFHEALKRHFLPTIFSTAAVAEVRWTQAPRHAFSDDGRLADLAPAIAPQLGWAVAALAAAWASRAKL
jgi:ABC-2 type transport system permease protein